MAPRRRRLFDLLNKDGAIDVEEVKAIVAADRGAVKRKFAASEYADSTEGEGWVEPIWIACMKGHAETVRFLAENGGDVNEAFNIDCLVEYCFDVAVRYGHLDCLVVLHEKGAKLGHDLNLGNMANVAVYNNHPKVLRFLTSIGVGPVDDDPFSCAKPWEYGSNMTMDKWLNDKPDLRAAIKESQAASYADSD